jgi:tetratricopeptide (TPR) repeat protein
LSLRWQISAGELFELTRPASFALSALVSAWVLASARRHGFHPFVVAGFTLATLFYTLITLPLYLIARAARRRRQFPASQPAEQQTKDTPPLKQAIGPFPDSAAEPCPVPDQETTQKLAPEVKPVLEAPGRLQLRLRRTLPLFYLFAVLSLGALFYYLDAQSVDAHLARANRARLLGQRERTIRELRAALRLEENGHTRNLLGIELVAAGQLEEALLEFRAAERAGEPDDELPYRIAGTLDALSRQPEALPEYQKFLDTRRCTGGYPDPQCAVARARLRSQP